MFENLALRLLDEVSKEPGAELACLPFSRALLCAFETLKLPARPLVVRGVVFGQQVDPTTYSRAGDKRLIRAALEGPLPNACIESMGLRFPYRTIGQPHHGIPGDRTLGNYDNEGKWLGHLVVIANETLIDPSIGQLNDERYRICFNPPAITASVTDADAFLSGQEPLLMIHNGMLIVYVAYPEERTFEISRSWTDPEFGERLAVIGQRTAAHFVGQPESELHQ